MSVNKVILLGNVGQDPKVKYFDSGIGCCYFFSGNDRSCLYLS